MRSAAANEQAENKPDPGANADCRPRPVMHEIVGDAGRCLGLVDTGFADLSQFDLGLIQTFLNLDSDGGDFFAGLGCGRVEEFFGICNQESSAAET